MRKSRPPQRKRGCLPLSRQLHSQPQRQTWIQDDSGLCTTRLSSREDGKLVKCYSEIMDFGYSDTRAEWGAGNSLCGSLLSSLLELWPPLQHTHTQVDRCANKHQRKQQSCKCNHGVLLLFVVFHFCFYLTEREEGREMSVCVPLLMHSLVDSRMRPD